MRSRGSAGAFRVEELERRLVRRRLRRRRMLRTTRRTHRVFRGDCRGRFQRGCQQHDPAGRGNVFDRRIVGQWPVGDRRPVAQVPAKTFVIEGMAGQTTITNIGQAFQVVGSAAQSVTAIIEDLTIAGGRFTPGSIDPGGSGLEIDGADVSMDRVTISNEVVVGSPLIVFDPIPGCRPVTEPGNGYGGAVYVASGALTLQDDTFTGDSAIGGEGGGSAYGARSTSPEVFSTRITLVLATTPRWARWVSPPRAPAVHCILPAGQLRSRVYPSRRAPPRGAMVTVARWDSMAAMPWGEPSRSWAARFSLDQVNIDANRAVAGNGGDGGHVLGTSGINVFGGGNGGNASGGGLAIQNATVTALDSTFTRNVTQAGVGGVDLDMGSQANDGSGGVAQDDEVSNEGGTFTSTTTPTPTPTPITSPAPSSTVAPPVTVLGVQWQTQKEGARKKSEKVLVVTFTCG